MPRDLVERAMAGDLEAFMEMARLSIDRLYAVARLILRDTEKAEDATLEARVLSRWPGDWGPSWGIDRLPPGPSPGH